MSESLRLQSPCGSVFEITAEAVWADFRDMLKTHYEIDDAKADAMLARRQAEEPDHWIQWLKEQFTWQDIDKLGTVVSRPSSEEQIKALCDAYRSGDRSPIGYFIISD